MARRLILLYGVLAYGAFFCTILYMIGFVNGIIVPKSIDSGAGGSVFTALLVNLSLILAFGVSHSIMARPAFKRALTQIVPVAAERSTFVLVACAFLGCLFMWWRPIPLIVWSFGPPLSPLLFTISMLGWVLVFWSSFLIDHFDLFGLRQVWLNYRGEEYNHRPFVVRGLYHFIRHPLMLGFLIAFWVAPVMTIGHLLFAIAMTVYIIVGIKVEERDLVDSLGESYSNYKQQTPMLFPMWRAS